MGFLPETGSGFFGNSKGITRHGFDKLVKNALFTIKFGFFKQFLANSILYASNLWQYGVWWELTVFAIFFVTDDQIIC